MRCCHIVSSSSRPVHGNHIPHTVPDSLPAGPRTVVRVITTLATLAFLVIFVYSSFIFVNSAGKLKTTNLRIPMKYCYMVLAVGSCFMLYEFVKTIRHRITRPAIDVYDPENYRGEEDL